MIESYSDSTMKKCKQCNTGFEVTDPDRTFYDQVSPVFDNKKYTIPEPTLCPDCRQQRRMIWRNDRNLYERKCDSTDKKLISLYSPNSEITVYDKEIWWSDQFDAKKYGRDFDFDKPFFEQFHELMLNVPMPHIMTVDTENSLYTNYNAGNKNCYLCFAGNYLEDSLYCYNAEKSKDCVDCLFVFENECCYECIQSENCYNCKFVLHSKNCSDSWFLEDCTGCKNCTFCFNLKNKQYCILNKQYSKENFFNELDKYKLNTYSGLQKATRQWTEEKIKYIKRANHNLMSENCTGEYIFQSKNCHECFTLSKGCEDCKYILNGFPRLKDSYDCTYCGEDSSLLYESMGGGAGCYHMLFSNVCCINTSNIIYGIICFRTQNCFGCIGIQNAKYCILNKQYSKEEYEKLVPKIIEHMIKTKEWGEFPPAHFSPFAYNETIAQEHFPLNKEEVLNMGLKWKENTKKTANGDKIIPASRLPDKISKVPDDILNWAIECEVSKKPFKIISQELKFYRKHNLPIPHLHPDERYSNRIRLRNPRKLFSRKCHKCSSNIQTTYNPNRPEKIYCEDCYLKEVY